MDASDIINAYTHFRKTDMTVPDDVLDFMKIASLEKLFEIKVKERRDHMRSVVESKQSKYKWKHAFGDSYICHQLGRRDLEDAYNLEMKAKEESQ